MPIDSTSVAPRSPVVSSRISDRVDEAAPGRGQSRRLVLERSERNRVCEPRKSAASSFRRGARPNIAPARCAAPGHLRRKARQVGCRAPIPPPRTGMARAWETLAKYIDHYEEARAEPTKDAD